MSQKQIMAQHQKKYAKAINRAKNQGINSFQSWFDKSTNTYQSTLRGYWDVTCHILTPTICDYLDKPENKIALEIGYGGGRLLNAMCNYFKKVIGIDIHNEQQAVKKFLATHGKSNFRLIKTSGNSIEVKSSSIDFIYSFIVFQHLPTFSVLTNYLQEIYRCLKPKGLAQLYYGKYSKLNPLVQAQNLIIGYKEITNAPVNHTSLVIHPHKMKKICQNIGFKILDTGTSYKRSPDGYLNKPGGQNYITILKQS